MNSIKAKVRLYCYATTDAVQIRGNRSKKSTPDKAGGLKAAHLAAVQWLEKATEARTQGAHVGSTSLIFQPTKQVRDQDATETPSLWKQVYENGELVRLESKIPMSTPGSITLILQAILPYILFLHSTVPLRLIIEGGTNVSKSPSIEYVSQVLFPLLSKALALPPIETRILKRGWSTGRSDVGLVAFDIIPIDRDSPLRPFEFSDRGDLSGIHVSLIASDNEDSIQIKTSLDAQLTNFFPGIDVDFVVDEVSGQIQRCYLLVVAETTSGCRFGSDCLAERKAAKGHNKSDRFKADQNKQMVARLAKKLKDDVLRGGCVDEFMEDQLVVFQSIANGKTRVDSHAQPASLHTQTARWVAEEILGVAFNATGSCKGAGLCDGAKVGDVDKEERLLIEKSSGLQI